MTFDEQDSLIESLNAAYDKAGTITDEDIKELFAQKNAIADEDEQTSYEFDEFFAEVVSKWAQDGLTDEKAQLLLNLIDSADSSVDDSEDAMLEELSMAELTGVDISEILKDKFPDYFEQFLCMVIGYGIDIPARISLGGGCRLFFVAFSNTPNARHWHYCYQFMVTDFRLRYI